MSTKHVKKTGNSRPAGTLKIGVSSFTACLTAVILLWLATIWLCLGESESLLPTVPAFLLVCGPFLCLAFTLEFTWDYFRSRTKHASIFVLGIVTGMSPLFFFGLIVAVTLWKSR